MMCVGLLEPIYNTKKNQYLYPRDYVGKAYSNFKAAVELAKPETKATISHGRREFRDVRTAPPLTTPLCWLRRRGGLGVEPM